MSVTFYVDGWAEQPKVETKIYLHKEYLLDEDENPEYLKFLADTDELNYQQDEKGLWYRTEMYFEQPYPELNLTSRNCGIILSALGYEVSDCGTFPTTQLGDVFKRAMALRNNPKNIAKNALKGFREGNFIEIELSAKAIESRLTRFLELIAFATKHGREVYWG